MEGGATANRGCRNEASAHTPTNPPRRGWGIACILSARMSSFLDFFDFLEISEGIKHPDQRESNSSEDVPGELEIFVHSLNKNLSCYSGITTLFRDNIPRTSKKLGRCSEWNGGVSARDLAH